MDGSSHFFLFERWRYRSVSRREAEEFESEARTKSFFTPEGKVALAFLKMYTGLSAPKLMDALNGNIHYQIFCGIRISPENQLTNYKLIDSISGRIVQETEDSGAAEGTCRCMEAVHEEP